MAQKKSILKRVRLVYRRSSPLLKAIVLGMLCLCTVTLAAISVSLYRGNQENLEKQKAARAEERENQELKSAIVQLGSTVSTLRIAYEELGLVDPDSIVFDPVEGTTAPD